MSISPGEFERRYAAVQEQMKKAEIDCILVYGLADDFNRGNIRYITGSGRGGCCVFPTEGAPVFFTGPNQSTSPKLRRTTGAIDLLDIRETTDTVKRAIEELSHFYKGNKVGVAGMGCISVPMYLTVEERFKEKVIDSEHIFERVREVKSSEEIEKTKMAATIADSVYAMLRKIIHPGLSEYDIYGAVKKTIYEMGCEYSFDLIDDNLQGLIRVRLKYGPRGEDVLHNLKRESKPGRRVYAAAREVPQVLNGLGISIVSTSQGVLSDRVCREKNVGGEVLCSVY